MSNIKTTVLILIVLLISMCSLPEVPGEITDPADPSFNLLAPTLLSAIPITDVRIELVWRNNEDLAKEFVVYRKTVDGSLEPIATVPKDKLVYVDESCVLGTNYTYSLKSQVESNLSIESNSMTTITTFPSPTSITDSAISDISTQLNWIDNCSFEDGYRLERDGGVGFEQIVELTANITTFTDSNLQYGIDYTYRVAGYTAANTSTWATSGNINTTIPMPTNLNVTAISNDEIRLNWVDNCSYEDGFRIERDDGVGYSEVGTVSADVTEYRDIGLTYGQSYNYRVAAYTSVNTSSWATITATTGFPAPSDLTASSLSDSEIQLTWTDNTGYESGFKIERNDGSGFTEIGTVLADVTEYTDTGLTFAQSYTYRVAAYTSANTSSWATITAATEFPAPSDLTARSVSDSEIQLTWTDNTDYETGFKIERDDGSGFSDVGSISEDVTEYTDSGLNFGESYDYRVAAYTASNTSDYSATVTATTPLVDWDGNTYGTVKIGNQVWMAENLKVTHYRYGTPITHESDNTAWENLSTEAYCIYNNNASNEVDTFGALYNWYAVDATLHNLAPEGWHVPTDDEWKQLEMYLGMSQSEADVSGLYRGTNEGSKLAGSADLWDSGNLENNSEFGTSGFTALPGGYRYYGSGYYYSMGYAGYFWSATEYGSTTAWNRLLGYDTSAILRNYSNDKRYGLSVRLVRD